MKILQIIIITLLIDCLFFYRHYLSGDFEKVLLGKQKHWYFLAFITSTAGKSQIYTQNIFFK